jgi:AraC family transcriptional regulator
MTLSPAASALVREPRQLSWLRDIEHPPEPCMLQASQLRAWAGFRVGIFQAVTYRLDKRSVNEHPALSMILKGRTRSHMCSHGEEFDLSPGPDTIGVFAPHRDIRYQRWECEVGAERMSVELDFSDLELAGDMESMLPPRRTLRQNLALRDAQLASLMRLVAQEVRAGSPHGALYATSLSLGLAAYLFSHHGSGGRAPARERGRLTAAQKTRVVDLVQRKLAEDLDLADLAAAAGVSRFHFLRLFKNTFGVTPYRFVIDRRIEVARRLLVETNQPLADIAAAAGFSSQSHFCTAIRRNLGITPGQLRRASSD